MAPEEQPRDDIDDAPAKEEEVKEEKKVEQESAAPTSHPTHPGNSLAGNPKSTIRGEDYMSTSKSKFVTEEMAKCKLSNGQVSLVIE